MLLCSQHISITHTACRKQSRDGNFNGASRIEFVDFKRSGTVLSIVQSVAEPRNGTVLSIVQLMDFKKNRIEQLIVRFHDPVKTNISGE